MTDEQAQYILYSLTFVTMGSVMLMGHLLNLKPWYSLLLAFIVVGIGVISYHG